MKLFLYHGTIEKYAIDDIGKQKIFHSAGENHYLGDGIYLYSDPLHALVWASMKTKRYQKNKESAKPAVLEVQIDIPEENHMDLDQREFQDIFFEYREKYLKLLKQSSEIKYYTDSHFCNFLSARIAAKMISKTFVYIHPKEDQLPVLNSNNKDTNVGITRHYRTEKQFCLKDDSFIKHIYIWEKRKE